MYPTAGTCPLSPTFPPVWFRLHRIVFHAAAVCRSCPGVRAYHRSSRLPSSIHGPRASLTLGTTHAPHAKKLEIRRTLHIERARPAGGFSVFLTRVDPSAAQLAVCDSSLWDHIGLTEGINQVPVMVIIIILNLSCHHFTTDSRPPQFYRSEWSLFPRSGSFYQPTKELPVHKGCLVRSQGSALSLPCLAVP